MISDVEYLYIYLLATCVSSLENVCSVPLPSCESFLFSIFFFFFFAIELYEFFIYIVGINPYQVFDLQMFSTIL